MTTALMTKREVAAYLRVSTRTVDNLVRERKLHFLLVGSRRRFREADVLFYVASRSFGPSHNADPANSTSA